MIAAIGFDLDNTLYDQTQHIHSFFRETAGWLSPEYDLDPSKVETTFVDTLKRRTSYYPNLFDEALESLGIADPDLIKALIERYHAHRAVLTPYADTLTVLRQLSEKAPLFMVTDGRPAVQQGKVEALNIGSYFKVIVYTGDHAKEWRKPGTASFQYAVDQLGVYPVDCWYIGDNPMCDFEGANALGMTTVRLRKGFFAAWSASPEQDARHNIDELSCLLPLIESNPNKYALSVEKKNC